MDIMNMTAMKIFSCGKETTRDEKTAQKWVDAGRNVEVVLTDGNGRTARLWQTVILSSWKELFRYIPIESIIRKHQEKYYEVIQNCNNSGNSNEFIEFMLEVIDEAIDDIIIEQEKTTQETTQKTTQEKILELIRKNPNITQTEMAKILEITRDGISYNIKILRDKGIIVRERFY